MLIPIIFMRMVEKIMKMSPAIAEVITSLPALTLSGIPPEVVIKNRP